MLDFINTPWFGALAAVLLSAAIRALPEPLPMGSRFYLWFYRFSNFVLSNYDRLKTQQ